MMKKSLCVIFSLILLLSLPSCASINPFASDMGDLSFDEDGVLLYHGNRYYQADDRFYVRTELIDAAIELGYSSNFPFFPNFYYYALEEETPLFIWGTGGYTLYVREDYDLYGAIYCVEDTDIEIALCDAMTKFSLNYETTTSDDISRYRDMTFHLKEEPRIYVFVAGPYRHKKEYGCWYFMCGGQAWRLSDALVAQLEANGIL